MMMMINSSSSSSSSSSSLSSSSVLMLCFYFFFFFFIIFVGASSTAAAGRENQLFEFLTRMDMVELAGYGEEKLSSVLVTGSVHCKITSCALDNHGGSESDQLHAWPPVQGASVAVTCKTGGKTKRSSGAHGITDEYGDFVIDLPSKLHAYPNLDKACIARVLRLPKNSPCRQVFARKPKGIRLSSVGNSIRTYTAGSITFRHSSNPSQPCLIKKGETGYKDHVMRF